RVAAIHGAVWPFVEHPAFFRQPRPGVGNGDHVLQPLEHAKRQRASGPGADPGNPQVIAPRLSRELSAGIGGDPFTQRAFDSPEAPVRADFLGSRGGVQPLAVIELRHAFCSRLCPPRWGLLTPVTLSWPVGDRPGFPTTPEMGPIALQPRVST